MTRSKSTKRAMCTSIFSVLVCSAMLLGSTYAWFSDTANASNNNIVAGKLDVGLEYYDESTSNWQDASSEQLFDEDFLWEPGAMLISEKFRVTNEGNLALRYSIGLNVDDVPGSGDESLTDVIEMKVVNADDSALTELQSKGTAATQGERATAWDGFVPTGTGDDNTILPSSGDPAIGDEKVVVLYWKPNTDEVDNKYNGTDATINFGVNVFATQTPHEKDSFGSDYDKDIPVVTMASNNINKAVSDNVPIANSTLSSKGLDGKISFSELNYDSVNDKYVSTVTFTTNDFSSIGDGAEAVAGLITDAVKAQKANIATITIGGHDADIQNADLSNSDWLGEPLTQWLTDIGGGTLLPDGIQALMAGGQSCDVVITDKDGFAVTYNLAFVFDV